MFKKRRPPAIRFYEDDHLRYTTAGYAGLVVFVKRHSFGLLRTNAQASVFLLLVLAIGVCGAIYYIRSNQPVAPTTEYRILPQESVGSEQGLPPQLPADQTQN